MIKAILLRYAAWLLRNASARIYTNPTPIGARIGGADIPQLPDVYFILDVRVASKILILGWFQAS